MVILIYGRSFDCIRTVFAGPRGRRPSPYLEVRIWGGPHGVGHPYLGKSAFGERPYLVKKRTARRKSAFSKSAFSQKVTKCGPSKVRIWESDPCDVKSLAQVVVTTLHLWLKVIRLIKCNNNNS